MKSFFTLIAATAALVSVHGTVRADELDQAPKGLPQILIVRTDASGNHEVFKAQGAKITDAASAAAANAAFVTPANKISDVKPVGELDQATSSEAWYYVQGFGGAYQPYYYYNTYAASAYYYPYYNYSYGFASPYTYSYYGYSPYYYYPY